MIKILIELHSIEEKVSGSIIIFLMSFAIRVNRVKVMHGNKKLYIRQSMLLHVCVVMWNDLVEMEKFDEAIKKGEFLEQCC